MFPLEEKDAKESTGHVAPFVVYQERGKDREARAKNGFRGAEIPCGTNHGVVLEILELLTTTQVDMSNEQYKSWWKFKPLDHTTNALCRELKDYLEPLLATSEIYFFFRHGDFCSRVTKSSSFTRGPR